MNAMRGPVFWVLIACAFSAGIHFALVPSHADESAGLGAGLALAGLLLLAFALAVFMEPHSAGAALAMAALLAFLIVAYLLSRTAGLPALGHGREPFDGIGVLTKLAELGALLASVHLYFDNGSRPAPLLKTRSNP
jgi:hypothetical protein